MEPVLAKFHTAKNAYDATKKGREDNKGVTKIVPIPAY